MGFSTAPALRMPKAAATYSTELPSASVTRSPGRTPRAESRFAARLARRSSSA